MIKSMDSLYHELGFVAGEMHRRQWAECNAGNISVNITSLLKHSELAVFPGGEIWKEGTPYKHLSGQHILISLSGSRMYEMANEPAGSFCHLKFDHDGNPLIIRTQESKQPTSEIHTHLLIQEYFAVHSPENMVLIHTHPNEIIALSLLDEFKDSQNINSALKDVLPETMHFLSDGFGLIPFTEAGNKEIAIKTLEEFRSHRLVIWARHGCLACGPAPRDAYDLIDVVAKAAHIFLLCKSAGQNIRL